MFKRYRKNDVKTGKGGYVQVKSRLGLIWATLYKLEPNNPLGENFVVSLLGFGQQPGDLAFFSKYSQEDQRLLLTTL